MKQKDIPKVLFINGNEWKIRFVKNLSKYDTKREVCQGICLFDEKQILIKSNLSIEEMLSVVFHEAIHAMESEYEINLDHDHVYTLGRAMADIFLSNFKG